MKRLAVLMFTILLVLSTQLAFANTSSGQSLQAMGIISGDESGNLNEDLTLTRAQAAKLIVTLNGGSETAINENLQPSFTDSQNSWYSPYLAYAERMDWIHGYDDGTFKPDQTLSKQEWTSMLMNVLGYPYQWGTVVEDAAKENLIVSANYPISITRGEAFNAIEQALYLKLYNSNVTLINALGLDDQSNPYNFKIVNVDSSSLVRTSLKFNQPIDEYSATNVDNYSFTYSKPIIIYDIDLSPDGKTVSLYHTAITNDSMARLNVKPLMNAKKDLMAESFDKNLTYEDVSAPIITGIFFTGPYEISIYFSEPISNGRELGYNDPDYIAPPYKNGQSTLDIDQLSIENDNHTLYISDDYELKQNHTHMVLTTMTQIQEGTTTIDFPAMFEDYAGNAASEYTRSYSYKKPTMPPKIIGYKDGATSEITLIYDKPIIAVNGIDPNYGSLYQPGTDGLPYYYHTNDNNPASSIEVRDNQLTLHFASSTSMPLGTVYVHVLDNAIKDGWSNMSPQVVLPVEIDLDLQATRVTAWTFNEERDQLTLEFSSYLNEESALDLSNYQLVNVNGKDVSSTYFKGTTPHYLADFNKATSSVTLFFNKPMNEHHTLYLKDVMDAYDQPINWTVKF